MGKRKYESNKGDSFKKSKQEKGVTGSVSDVLIEDQPQNDMPEENEEKTHSGHPHFDVKHFRKELAAKQGQTMILTQFLQVCLNTDNEVDCLLAYLKSGGNSHEILRQITQENKKNLTLATPAFHIFHLIIMKVQSSLPHLISVTEEACRYFLNTFMSTVEIMISENSGPRHRKIVLKLLTSMVTLNPDLGIEVLNQAPLTPKHLQYIIDKSNYKEKDNVRTAFVHFMTSFIVDGHLPLIKALLEKQGLLALVIPGLIYDEAEAVLMFLNILKKNVVDNSFISKSLKLKTFSHQVLHNMFRIFSWKGPPEQAYKIKNESRSEIMNLLSNIMLTLFTSHRLGLYFTDNYLGTAEANKNQNLYKALLTLKRPWENEHEAETILEIIHKCPDLHRSIISVIEQCFEPQHSPIWERATDFVIKLLDKLKPEDLISRMSNLSSTQVANFIRFITLPVPLLKFIQPNIGKDQAISLICAKVLVKMLHTLKSYMQILEMNDSQSQITDLCNRLEYFVPKHLPAPSVIVTQIKDIINGKKGTEARQDYQLTKPTDTDSLITLVDLLLLYNDVHPAFFETLESSLDMKCLLEYSSKLSEEHGSLLKFKIVSLWLTMDNSAISLKNPMFKDLFLIMLEVYTDEDDTWIEAKDTLLKFFKNTLIFEGDEDEIHLILYTLRCAKVNPTSTIADIVEYVLSNIKELTEYVRNQIVHFEISDENSKTNLDKLFNDLMENKNTQDSVFLENKVPSPFIVGCMQYVQNHKEVKKNLKQFLSLYVVNLLHSNYSPELTEVLIGDCKLDARNYVTSWTSQPVSIPDTVVEKDDVIKQISKSIIVNKEISMTNIFQCLEETSEESSDVIINGAYYKVNIMSHTDSSDLITWAKYLIYCTVRLTDMQHLKEVHQDKIANYFDCLIAIAKKHHMMDVCRTIILTLLKNSQVLKIYKPINVCKGESNILATEFVIDIIVKYKSIVEYLNRKSRVLKSFQQKNYNEIVKAFIKISKRKNVTCEHTIRVLEVIGLSRDDDLRVFNQIFAIDANMCYRDDKEPSMVLEILRVLIEKYTESMMSELPQGTLKKSMKLYSSLLTNTEIIPNLTGLETALTKFFENKPHHVSDVTDEIFKKFFNANTVRKTTSQLASTLLKLNGKFCSISKEQICRAEILSLRELTLPLGSAIIHHKHFLKENKEFLVTIYNEYKTNIFKLLEKPHKAGQIYITCWTLINKLILDCMEENECEKIFMKVHKFETVELSHINLMQSVFLKLCLSEAHKKEHFINYLSTMLTLTTVAIKEGKEYTIMKQIVSNIYNVVKISRTMDNFNIAQKEDFQKVIESSIWQNFFKATLKDSLKVKTVDQGSTLGPELLHLLSTLVKLFYPTDHDDIVTLFEMVTSHSEFLNVMLSHHSADVKSRLIEFLFTLISTNKSVMKSQQIPVYLSAYHATRSPCDRLILTILHYYESNGLPVNEYKPYVFGDSAAGHYAVRKNRTSSLWAHPTPSQIINLFDKETLERTVRHFPVAARLDYRYELRSNIDVNDSPSTDTSITSSLEKMCKEGVFKPHHVKDSESSVQALILKAKFCQVLDDLQRQDLTNLSHAVEDESVYDPVFLLSLLSHLLAPGSVASCFRLLRTGLLSLPVMALSSHCGSMRAAAYHVLYRFYMLLDTETKHKNDKLFLNDFVNTLRQSLSSAISNEETSDNLKNPRLPAIDALFLAKALMVSTAPSDPLYKPVNNFFIAKQFVDLTAVPDFLSLFHDSDVESSDRRLWILDIVKDGTKTMTDVNVIFKTMCLKMMMAYSSSVLSDSKSNNKILGVLTSIVAIPRAFEILIEGYGLMSWLHSFVKQMAKTEKSTMKRLMELLKVMLQSVYINAFAKNVSNVARNGKALENMELKLNKDVENEILAMLCDLMPHMEHLEIDDVCSYVGIYNLLSKRAIKLLTKHQVTALLSKCSVPHKDSEVVVLLTKVIVKKEPALLKSKLLKTENCLLKELSTVVDSYCS